MIRYGIVHKCSSMYVFVSANQGRCHFDTRKEAEEWFELARTDLESKLGQVGHRVIAIDCWENGDSKRSVFGREIEDPELQKFMDEARRLEIGR